MENIGEILDNYITTISLPRIGIIDIIEILLISVFVYQFMLWIKNTRAYTLMKGILVVAAFIFVAYIFEMNTILWIVQKLGSVLIMAILIIFQPELRKVLEQLGEKKYIAALIPFDSGKEVKERFTDKTIVEIARACFDMGEVKTGALIVIEGDIILSEYERTGIMIDSLVSSQLLINIFEHNTPLHDGAVIVRNNRIVAATCYLPLSDNMALSKQLGTRHRAGVGISEVSDSLTIIVSEETGKVSTAMSGKLNRDVSMEELKAELRILQNKTTIETSKFKLWKGRFKHDQKTVE